MHAVQEHAKCQSLIQQTGYATTRLLKWEVALSHDGKASTRTFDRLIVAAGANHTPRIPDSDLFKNFKGEIIHSSQYHSAEQVRGKKVLVVGMGESSVDVATSAAKVAESCTLYNRRHTDFAPRFVDQFLNNKDYDERTAMNNAHKPNALLEHITISRTVRNLPLAVWSLLLHMLTKEMSNKFGKESTQDYIYQFDSRAWSPDYFSSDTSQVPTKASMVFHAAVRGFLDIVVTPNACSNGKTVSFDRPVIHGASVKGDKNPAKLDRDFDVIVACTGFGLDFDWIQTSDPSCRALNPSPRTWFKHSFPPGFGEHLAFVGFARPHSGGIPQCSEMVSRYIAQLYQPGGNLKLPSNYEELALSDGAAERACFHLTPNYELLVDYMAYMNSVAKLVGCTPRVPLHPLEMVKYWTFPLWPCFYRTQGVGANPEAAQKVLDKFGPWDSIAPMPLLAVEIVFTFIMPLVNFLSFCADALRFPAGRPLPLLYQFSMSKTYFLYHNSLDLGDFKLVLMQWVAATLSLFYILATGLKSVVSSGSAPLKVSPIKEL